MIFDDYKNTLCNKMTSAKEALDTAQGLPEWWVEFHWHKTTLFSIEIIDRNGAKYTLKLDEAGPIPDPDNYNGGADYLALILKEASKFR